MNKGEMSKNLVKHRAAADSCPSPTWYKEEKKELPEVLAKVEG